MTEWRPIPGWPGYEASDEGGIRSFRTPGQVKINDEPRKELAPYIKDRPPHYLQVQLRKRGGTYMRHVHSLVALAFHGPRPKGKIVCHVNGIASDNRPNNLVYGSYADNEHAKPGALTRAQVEALRLAYAEGEAVKDIAARFKRSAWTIRAITAGESYADYPGPIYPRRRKHEVLGKVLR